MAISEDSSTPVPAQVADSADPGGTGAINPMSLTVAQLARMLAVSEEKVREHVAAGAPTAADPDGQVVRINLVHYVAWLTRELVRRDGN